jgi:AcrR family transcriptional regulator
LSTIDQLGTRDRLLIATERLLLEGGLAAVTTQSVARAVGMAEGTIYRHFGSRDELVESTIRERFPCDFERLARELVERAGHGEVESNLQDFVTGVMPLFNVIAPTVAMLAAHPNLATRHYTQLSACGKGPRFYADLVAKYFVAEQQLGRVRSDIDPKAAAGLVSGICFHRALLLQLFGEDPTGLSNNELPAAIAAILSRGVKNDATSPQH